MNVEKPKTVNEGNEFEKQENEPTPVQRFVMRQSGSAPYQMHPSVRFLNLCAAIFVNDYRFLFSGQIEFLRTDL